jgi:hypothetical protein
MREAPSMGVRGMRGGIGGERSIRSNGDGTDHGFGAYRLNRSMRSYGSGRMNGGMRRR